MDDLQKLIIALSNGTIPDPFMVYPSSRLGVCNLAIPPLIPGTGKVTDFKFGRYI